jgi:hypothetical protein
VVTQLLDFDHPSAQDMEPAIRLTRCVTTQACHIIPFSLNDFDAKDSNARVRFFSAVDVYSSGGLISTIR